MATVKRLRLMLWAMFSATRQSCTSRAFESQGEDRYFDELRSFLGITFLVILLREERRLIVR